MYHKEKKNQEDLTFEEWLSAATYNSCFLVVWWYKQAQEKGRFCREIARRMKICRARWQNGEDPTKTRFHNQFQFGDTSQNFV
jgi:hypothetical protein